MPADAGEFRGRPRLGRDPVGADEPGEQCVRLVRPEDVQPVDGAAVRGDDRGESPSARDQYGGVLGRGEQRQHLPGAGRVVEDEEPAAAIAVAGPGEQFPGLVQGEGAAVRPGQREGEHPAGELAADLVRALVGQRRLADAWRPGDDDKPGPVGRGQPGGDGPPVALAPGEPGHGRQARAPGALPGHPAPAAVRSGPGRPRRRHVQRTRGGGGPRRIGLGGRPRGGPHGRCHSWPWPWPRRGPDGRPRRRTTHGSRLRPAELLGPQDGQFQAAQSGPRVDAELVAQPVPYRAVLGEGLRLPPRAVEGLDELLGEALAHRMAAGALVQVDQHLVAVPGGEFEIADPLQHAQPLLFERGHRVAPEHPRGHVGERRPVPQGQRLAQPVQLLARSGGGRRPRGQGAEEDEIEGLGVVVHPVSARHGLDGGRGYAVLRE